MNKIIKNLTFGAAAALCLAATSCDDIDKDDRYIDYEKPVSEKVVVLWKFTGQRCIYCPGGDDVINAIHNANPNNFIAVGLHPENNNFTRPLSGLDLTCPAATTYMAYYNPDTFPYAIVDGNKNMMGSEPNDWRTFVNEILLNNPSSPAFLTLKTKFNEGNRTVDIDYNVNFTDVVPPTCMIQLWIIENNIIGAQLLSTGKPDKEYVHNHVLRAAINGDWGEEINGDIIPSFTNSGDASIQLKDNWVPENCQIVAFIYDKNSKKIYQGAICNVVDASSAHE